MDLFTCSLVDQALKFLNEILWVLSDLYSHDFFIFLVEPHVLNLYASSSQLALSDRKLEPAYVLAYVHFKRKITN